MLNDLPQTKIRVLHVDDDSDLLEVSKTILIEEGIFEIDTASCVDDALKKLESLNFDVVVSDYDMPVKDGLMFLRQLRDKKNEIPFILFTGKGREEVAIKALNLGADGYYNKQGTPETVYGELSHGIRIAVEGKRAEEACRISDAMLEKLAAQASGMLYQFKMKPDGTFCMPYANEVIEKFFGCQPEDVREDFSPIAKVILPEDLEKLITTIKYSAKNLTPWIFEGQVQIPNQEIRRMWGQSVPEKLADGSVVWHGYIVDLTERRKLESAMQEKLDMLEAFTENMGIGFVTISKDYRILYANKFVKNNCGEVEGKQCYSTLNDLDHICPDCGVKKVFEYGVAKVSHEYTHMAVDGKPYFVEIIATPLKDKQGNLKAGLEFVVDIAEKKLMQQKLQTSEEKFRAISENAIDAIFMFDKADRITYWNPAAERIFGYNGNEIINKQVNETIVPSRFRKDHLKLTSELGYKKTAGELLEFNSLRKDGTEFSIEISIAPMQISNDYYFVAIARDITERKKAEEKLDQLMNQMISLNEKLDVVGSLTRHDVRNKLSTVTGYSYLLKKKYSDHPDIVTAIDKQIESVKEIGRIFEFAKIYEELGAKELSYVDVEKAINEAVALFSGLTFKIVNDCHGLLVLSDSFLRQLFYNLIDNSLKHGEKVTQIRIYCSKAGDNVNLTYEDDGVGIPEANRQKLFSKGFTTTKGTGFGLSLIQRMVDVNGWSITEQGKPGKGVKFIITIPSAAISSSSCQAVTKKPDSS